MKINQSESSLYSTKQKEHEVQNREVSKITALNFFSDRLGNNSIAIPVRQKRDANQDKKAMCDRLKLGSLTAELTSNIANTVASASGGFNILGVPVGAPAAGIAATTSISSYAIKYGLDLKYIAEDCDNLHFNEIKEILKERLTSVKVELKNNYYSIRKNLEAIHENYRLIKRVEDKVDRNLDVIQSGFNQLSKQLIQINIGVSKVLEKIDEVISKKFISNLIIFINQFHAQINQIKYLSSEQVVLKLRKGGLLDFLKKTKDIYSETSLHSILENIIVRQLADPKHAQDTAGFTALYLLCLGTETYVSVLTFLLRGYMDLAEDSYQRNELENYNQYFSLALITAKDFAYSLNGGDNGLINKVISVLNRVKHKYQKNEIALFLSRKIDNFNQIKPNLFEISNLSYSKPSEQIKYEFAHATIETPFLAWKTGRKVSYAIQYRNNNIYSQVGDWSNLYTLSEKACPELEIGTAPQNTTRFIFRKFDSDKPELVGIIKSGTQKKFKDIDRDVYNLALEENEETTEQDIKKLLDKGANPRAHFEQGRQPIHAATQSSNLPAVKALLRGGVDINAKDAKGYTPLHIAAKLGYENFIKELITLGAEVNALSNLNQTGLYFAVEEGHLATVISLLSADGINPNIQAVGGFTPLHLAVSSNKNRAVIPVLASNSTVNINMQSAEGLTPLHLAVLSEHVLTVIELLNNPKIDINLAAQGNLTALHLAAIIGNKEITERLLEKQEINVNARSEQDWAPLHLAVSLKKKEVIIQLLSTNKINVNVEGTNRLTPMHLATETGSLEIVRLLFEKEANIHVKNDEGLSPIDIAKNMLYQDIVAFFTEVGASITENTVQPSVVDMDDGRTPLHSAAENGHLVNIEKLLNEGADIHAQDNACKTPLHLAVENGHFLAVKKLLDKGANTDVNVMDKWWGKTPLHWAAENGNKLIVQELIARGADVKLIAKHVGKSPLHLAAEKGRLAVVEVLLAEGADIDVQDKINKETPLHLAAKNGHLAVVEKLLEEGADIHARDNFNENPSYLANKNGHLAVVRRLQEKDREIAAADFTRSSQRYHRSIGSEASLGGSHLPSPPNSNFSPKSSIANRSIPMIDNQTKNQDQAPNLTINHDSVNQTMLLTDFIVRHFTKVKQRFFIEALPEKRLLEERVRSSEKMLEDSLDKFGTEQRQNQKSARK